MRDLVRLAIALATLTGSVGCMDPLHDYDTCVAVETARCEKRGTCEDQWPDFDVDSCVAYYQENCRTREINGPGAETANQSNTDACVAAIHALDCIVLVPGRDETDLLPACGFLESDPDAGAGGGDSDTATATDSDTATDSASETTSDTVTTDTGT